ncbi:hypothetical protein AX15_005789 [Amanita polypyramis BW_CC]|nr:hypothetical protein AX15_005789 [Amanita polypyramis BW_CC]
MLLFIRSLKPKLNQHARYLSTPRSGESKNPVIERMEEIVHRLSALETPDAADPSKPADLSSPKPNALQQNPREEPLPPLPAPVRGYPTPWVTEHDVLSYVYPLYTRGWGQSLKLWTPPPQPDKAKLGKETSTEEKKASTRNRQTVLLSARYRFKDYGSATSFFLKLVKVAKSENHHPSVHIANGNPFTVTVTTQTDSARRPTWVEEEEVQAALPPPPPPSDAAAEAARETTSSLPPKTAPASPLAPLNLPGVTLRDVRLAILTETIYNTDFSSHLTSLGRHIHPANFRLSWSTMERIWKRQVFLPSGGETGRKEKQRRWVEQRIKRSQAGVEERKTVIKVSTGGGARVDGRKGVKCYACGEEHHIKDCQKREQIKPQGPCPHCQEMHWVVDCPVKPAKRVRSDAPR